MKKNNTPQLVSQKKDSTLSLFRRWIQFLPNEDNETIQVNYEEWHQDGDGEKFNFTSSKAYFVKNEYSKDAQGQDIQTNFGFDLWNDRLITADDIGKTLGKELISDKIHETLVALPAILPDGYVLQMPEA